MFIEYTCTLKLAWETELLNVKLFCLLVCLLGQHEQKSTSLMPMIIAQIRVY